ncbi:MAG: tetratricopeptide repeat protein [Bdellovibrionota bacterium]
MMEREPYRPGLVRNQNLVQQLKELQKNPRSLVFVTLADNYRAEGLPHQALDILDEGMLFHPGLASALISKARCLFDLRRFAEASSVCRDILAANPANIKAQKLQADIFVRLGQRRAAIRALTKVVSLFPQDREAVKALEELEGLETGVIVPPEKLSRASTDAPPVLGRIDDFQVGSFSESLAAIPSEEPVREFSLPIASPVVASQSEEDDDSAGEPTFATRTIAELYLRQGLKRKAMKVLRKILQEDPGHVWARETLQDLGSDGIVPLAQKSAVDPRRAALAARARMLEQMLAQVRMRRAPTSGA